MLKLRNRPSHSPFSQLSRRLQLSAVHHEDDELIEAIENDHKKDIWTLDPSDAADTGDFWTSAKEDLEQNPESFDFARD